MNKNKVYRVCREEVCAYIRYKIKNGNSNITNTIKNVSKELSIPYGTLINWYYPKGNINYEKNKRFGNRKKRNDVYFIQGKITGYIKIGFSTNSLARIQILRKSNGEELEILHIIKDTSRQQEKDLHKKFKQYHLHDEWYRPGEKLLTFITKEKE